MATEQFEKEVHLNVPAKGAFGDPPKREYVFDFILPDEFKIQRKVNLSSHGATIIHKNLDGLAEFRLEIQPIENGVRLNWGLENPHSFPVNGRTGYLKFALTGVKQGADESIQVAFSPKYQKIRKSFFDHFYYAGQIATWTEANTINFGDQTIYMGQALIFLATEVFIKRRLGQDVGSSIARIKEILEAIDQLDQEAETLYGYPPILNGFIVRDNITGPNDSRLQGKFTEVISDWQKPEDAAPSGDQVFGLMYGLWFVVKFSDDSNLIKQVQAVADRIFLHVKNQKFELKLPSGEPVKRGSDIRGLASLLHGLNRDITGKDRFAECRINVLGQDLELNFIATFWDKAGKQSANMLHNGIDIPPLGKQSINSYAAHILLMAIAPSSIWSQQQLEDVALFANHHLAVLIYAAAHTTKPLSIVFNDINEILKRCPDDGPRGDIPVKTSWQRDNRWIRCLDIDKPGDGQRLYNGVDFLMLHNLAHIVFSQQ